LKTLQFEALKVALKQDKTGYILTLCMHPDDIPLELLRDFVGARYQVVMVRVDSDDKPLDVREFEGDKFVRLAGMMCRDKEFWKYLYDDTQIFSATETEATDWLRGYLNIKSRKELKHNSLASDLLVKLNREYETWKEKT
jgi:hypothetical protein